MIMRMLGLEGLVALMRLAAGEDSELSQAAAMAANDNGRRLSPDED